MVFASYRYSQAQLDTVVLTASGKIVLGEGEARVVAPEVKEGERRLGNVYLPGSMSKLRPENLFPIVEQSSPELPPSSNPIVAAWVRKL